MCTDIPSIRNNDAKYRSASCRSAKECVQMCRTVAKDLRDTLSPKGFIKCGITYMRRYGNALLQYITVPYTRAYMDVDIQVGVEPLYQCPAGSWRRWLPCLRTVEGLGGYQMHRIAGIEKWHHNFCYFDDYASAIAHDKDTLITCILPRLDEIRNAADVLHFNKFDLLTEPIYPNISLLLMTHKHDIVAKCLEEEIEEVAEHQKTVQRLFADGTINNAALEYHRKFDEERLSFCQRLLPAVIHNDQECIIAELEAALNAAYVEMEIYSKSFVKRYPQTALSFTE